MPGTGSEGFTGIAIDAEGRRQPRMTWVGGHPRRDALQHQARGKAPMRRLEHGKIGRYVNAL